MATEPTADVDRQLAGLDDSLRDLRDRIETLRRSIGDLEPGTPAPARQPPPPPKPPPAAAPQPATPPPPTAEPPPPAPATPPPATPSPPAASPGAASDDVVARLRGLLDQLQNVIEPAVRPAQPPASAPTTRPQAAAPTPQPPAAPTPQPPAAAPTSAQPSSVATINAGPFADLIALRSFEQALMSLPGIRDLRVRRFSQERAEIELLLAGPIAAHTELARLGGGIEVQPGERGVLRVEMPSQAGSGPGRGQGAEPPSVEGP